MSEEGMEVVPWILGIISGAFLLMVTAAVVYLGGAA